MAILLAAKEITSTRGERTLFANLNLEAKAGEIWQIKGPNGAGKSSLLRILVGLLKPQTGQVYFQDQPIQEIPSQYHRELLFIGHKAGIKAELTALENLSFYAQIQGLDRANNSDYLYEKLAQIGLVGLEDIPAQRLSAGQQRRIALARLLLGQPEEKARLWVLDEPFTSLDVAGVELLEQSIEAHLAQKGTVILTSHQPFVQLTHRQSIQVLNLEYQH